MEETVIEESWNGEVGHGLEILEHAVENGDLGDRESEPHRFRSNVLGDLGDLSSGPDHTCKIILVLAFPHLFGGLLRQGCDFLQQRRVVRHLAIEGELKHANDENGSKDGTTPSEPSHDVDVLENILHDS